MIKFISVSSFISVCLVSSITICPPEDEVKEEWKKFVKSFGRNFNTWASRERYDIFKQNYYRIKENNRRYRFGLETFEMGIGPFADRTEDEFRQMFETCQKECNKVDIQICTLTTNSSYPTQVDHTAIMQPAENQIAHVCNAGWAFAAVGTVEGVAMNDCNKDISLSPQNLIDCANGETYRSYGCKGGSLLGALYYMKTTGIQTSENYRYKAKESSCRKYGKVWKVKSIYAIRNTEKDLMWAVGTLGPIATTIEVTPNIMHYKKGIVFDEDCEKGPNHAVTIVGYGELDGQNYWLLRNSWGSLWGEKGYFKVSRMHDFDCHIGESAYFAHG